jgi:Tfp pilus assembly major pilin PilA
MDALNHNPTTTNAIHSKETSIMKSSRKRTPSSPRSQGGWTLIEIMIGAAVAVSLAAVVFSNFGDVVAQKSQTDAMTEIQDMRTKVQSWRSSKSQRGNTTDVSITRMIADGISLSRYTNGTGQNAYGRDIVVSGDGANWNLLYTAADQPSCTFLLNALANDSNLVTAPSCAGDTLSATFN